MFRVALANCRFIGKSETIPPTEPGVEVHKKGFSETDPRVLIENFGMGWLCAAILVGL